jgi:hypothetical protein
VEPAEARVGLLGDSQAGWIIPLAAQRDLAVRWALLNSGPTTTVGETDYWGQLAGESESPPSGTRQEMLDEVRAAGPSGFDPVPSLRALSIPVLWMYGSDDRKSRPNSASNASKGSCPLTTSAGSSCRRPTRR